MNENQKLGTIMKELIRFSLPLILSGVLQQLYNWADAFIVGNVDGELSLSAIGVTSIPISFFITTITGFTLGLSVLIAKNFGAKKQDSIPPVLAVFAVILGGVFLLAAAVAPPCPIRLWSCCTRRRIPSTSPAAISALFSGACRFWRSIMSIPPPARAGRQPDPIPLHSGLLRHQRTAGYPFCCGAALGRTGRGCGDCAVPSDHDGVYRPVRNKQIPVAEKWLPERVFLRCVVRDGLRYGLPPMVQSSISALGSLVLQDFMNRFGTDTVTAITTAYRIDTLILLPIVNLGSGISTVTAHSHGAGDTIRTRKTLSAGTILTLVVSAFLTGLVIPTGGKIIALFGAGTAAVAIGSAFFHRIAFFYPIFGLTTAFRGYLEGRGDLMYSSVAGLVSLAVRIIASYAMAPHFENMTIAYAEMVSWVWLLVMYLFRLAAKKDDAL